MLIARKVGVLRSLGLYGSVATLVDRRLHPRAKCAAVVRTLVLNKRVLEMGGPSGVFDGGGLVPVYRYADEVDNVDFAARTLWSGRGGVGDVYGPEGNLKGRRFVCEGSSLSECRDESYECVISSHVLEHMANPMKALKEWGRVCRVGGTLVLVLPHRHGTFDCLRPITTLKHLLEDEWRGVDEADDTHFEEILSLHDVSRDPGLPSREVLALRLKENSAVRSAHHHVFDLRSAMDMVAASGWTVVGARRLDTEPASVPALRRGPANATSGTSAAIPSHRRRAGACQLRLALPITRAIMTITKPPNEPARKSPATSHALNSSRLRPPYENETIRPAPITRLSGSGCPRVPWARWRPPR